MNTLQATNGVVAESFHWGIERTLHLEQIGRSMLQRPMPSKARDLVLV